MKTRYEIKLESEVEPTTVKVIADGLGAFNASHTGGEMPKYLVISLRDGTGAVVGGLVGATYLGWLHVNALWVPDELRGNRYGEKLLAQAEEEAVRRNCRRAFLETLSFQALGFYEKRGYRVFSKLEDFPIGGARYALIKELVDGEKKVKRKKSPKSEG